MRPASLHALVACLMTTSALVPVIGLSARPAAADSGDPCVMVGSACFISSTGLSPNGPLPDGGTGQPGGPAAALSSTLDNPTGLANNFVISPLDMQSTGGDGQSGAPSNNGAGGSGGDGGAGGDLTLSVSATVTNTPNGQSDAVSAVNVISVGGDAGGGAVGTGGNGVSATGGDGGTVTVDQLGGQWTALSGGSGVSIQSVGGTGGTGGAYIDEEYKFGADAGTGGDGGAVTATLTGAYVGFANGAYVASAGGNGGTGGKGDDAWSGQGGDGGTGGNGQSVDVTLATGASIEAAGPGGAGLWVQSVGGQGGQGGGGEIGGSGGQGGNADDVNVTVNGQILTLQPSDPGSPSPGVLAQSIGNVGGGGGHASDWSFNPTGGNGGSGGTPGSVTVTGTGANIQTGNGFAYGDLSPGVLAQSIGGMGGVGPDESGVFAVGGNGGDASNGDDVSASLTSSTVATIGFGAGGIVAQSIGGGGGQGGDATTSNGVLVNMDIGGTGGNGGDAAASYAGNLGGAITTSGGHSPGVVMQSVGGGGGAGGAAYGKVSSKIYGAQISVGGNGGAGGDGGLVNGEEYENNSGRIGTSGTESFGILAQSIGGGGGQGGASTAKAIVKGADDFPSFTLTMATGGDGGTAGEGEGSFVTTSGLVTTTGNGAIGVLNQSIGGGGGTGGDADATSKASGGNYGLTASITHGGKGQSGGNGGASWSQNGGLIITTGESADGMLVQSIGGGGGNGGAGDAKASDSADDASISATLSIGGQGGAGGSGADVTGVNTGSILTLGDGAIGLGVQAIGGGGGRGGGAAASASGTIEASVSLGGSGGDGGDTYYTASNSAVTNTGSIVTFGADATGIVAQSIGGGGGIGGKAGTSLGDAKNNGDGSNGSAASVGGTVANVQADYAANGSGALANYASLDQLLTTTNALLGNTASVSETVGDGDDIDNLDDTSATGGDTDDDNDSKSITLGVHIGGAGGSGGAAGLISVTNSGTVATMGRQSDAIVAQAIGGGGGKGGAASTASSSDIGGSVNVGGNGGSSTDVDANNGGQPTVTNSGTVYTVGALSSGIVAQSIAGGGGIGGTSSVTVGSGSEKSSTIPVNLGGLAKVANGFSEIALVENTGTIETRGHDSYGIIAQSISGGGGIVKTLAADLDNGNGSANSAASKAFDLDLSLGADGDTTSGTSGAVFVTNDTGGTITTSGDNGIGILAQSVAAGGGLALGGRPTGTTTTALLGAGTKSGDVNPGSSTDPADNQGVNVTVNGSIATSGAGGVGVFAQSVGGGGGIAGDIGNTMDFGGVGSGNVASTRIGNGGDIAVTVGQGATITTTNKNAPGIIAQSVGGGGGWFAGDTYALVGSAGGNGTGGDVTITVDGTVNAGGSASAGIIAQSTGGADNHGIGAAGKVSVTIGATGSLWGGYGGYLANQASLYILGAGAGSGLSNYGIINNNGTNEGYAVYVDPRVAAGNFTVTNQRNAFITGDVNLPSSNFLNYGNYFPLATVSLGDATLVNAGTVDLTKGASVTRLTGDFRGTSRSRLVVGADFVKGTADRLAVSGSATLGGGVAVRPDTLVPAPVTILTASNALDGQSLADATGAFLFDFTPKAAGNAVTITPSADFLTDGLSRDERSLAGHLQRTWDGDHPETMAKGFAALSGVGDADDYTDTLDRLASRQVGAIATARMETSRLFVANMQSCPVFEGTGLMLGETDCAWARAISAHLDHDGSTDAAGFDNDATLLQFGGQRAIGDGLFLSGAVGWENAQLKDDFGASADGDSWMAGVGVKYQSGPLLASATVDLGFGSFDTTRSFTVGDESFRATGSPDARNAGVHGRIAYELPQNGFYLRPSLDLDASWIGLDGYDESGAGDFDLSVDDSDSWILSATPAVEIGTRVDLADGTVLRPFANAGARFVSGNDWTVDARFQDAADGAGSFASHVDNPDAIATFGAGITVMTRGNLDLTAQYQGAFADGYTAQSGSLKATWRF